MSALLNRKPQSEAEEAEAAVVGLFAALYSRTIDEMKKKYGQEGFELARTAFLKAMLEGWIREYEKLPDRSLETYIRWLTSIVLKGARYEIVESSKTSVRFKFTACPWATFFRKLGKPEIGIFFCEADKPMLQAFNERLGFEITQKLMDGDTCCDHHFFLKSSD